MLFVFLGTDTKKALAALDGGGMFGEKRSVVLDRLSDNDELWNLVIDRLASIAEQSDAFFLYEEKANAATKKLLQKYAENVEIFDAPKSAKARPTVFALVNYMNAGDKKNLWVGYQQELSIGNAPEAIHGTLFWGVKQALLNARDAQNVQRSKRLLAELAELPHESRRHGEELEYALERFILSEV